MKRTFILGEEWLYYKLYTGAKTADLLLADVIGPLCKTFIANGWIDKWFFIRYHDPESHLRIRFHFTDLAKMGDLIQSLKAALVPYVADDRIWKVQADTYHRELERYGEDAIVDSETLFYHDSEMITWLLALLDPNDDEMRLLIALKSLDITMADFGLNLQERMQFTSDMQQVFRKEHQSGKENKEKLDAKYRRLRPQLENLLATVPETKEVTALCTLISQKSLSIEPLIARYKTREREKKSVIKSINLLHSYNHMTVNRFFSTRQRTYEWVCYDFLFKYYKSAYAKATKIN